MNAERDGIEQLLARAARGFERDAAVLAGDDERIERIGRAVQKRYAARPGSRVRQVALAVAVGMLLAGAALGALGAAGLLDTAKPAEAPTPGAMPPNGATGPRAAAPRPATLPAESAAPAVAAPALTAAASAELSPTPAASHSAVRGTAPSSAPGSELVELAPAPPLPEAAVKRFDDASSDETVTAPALFAAANRARVAGNVAEAMRLSRALLRTFPRSAEAISTHLSLGMLELQQGSAVEALGEFQAYEQQGSGATLAEALWGKAQALQRLGRANEERAALSELLARYPHGAYTAAAQKRLALLP